MRCRSGLVIVFVSGVEGRKIGSECIILFDLKHEKAVLNFEDVSKFCIIALISWFFWHHIVRHIGDEIERVNNM